MSWNKIQQVRGRYTSSDILSAATERLNSWHVKLRTALQWLRIAVQMSWLWRWKKCKRFRLRWRIRSNCLRLRPFDIWLRDSSSIDGFLRIKSAHVCRFLGRITSAALSPFLPLDSEPIRCSTSSEKLKRTKEPMHSLDKFAVSRSTCQIFCDQLCCLTTRGTQPLIRLQSFPICTTV